MQRSCWPHLADVVLVEAMCHWRSANSQYHSDRLIVVFDGRATADARDLASDDGIEVVDVLGRTADDAIADMVNDMGSVVELTVVTSDRGLRSRLRQPVCLVGSGTYLRALGIRPGAQRGRSGRTRGGQ